jgi:phosphatidylglycerol lysyltransferase
MRAYAENEMPLSQRMAIVRQYGINSLSFSAAVQSGLRHFGDSDSFLAFARKYGYTFVLGDPLGPVDRMEFVIDSFLKSFPRATFCQVSEAFAERLSGRRYWINQLGIDTRIDLARFDFRGAEKERFRYASNWLSRRGFQVRELEIDNSRQSEIETLSNRWRASRIVRGETAFLNRPLEKLPHGEMRHFFLLSPEEKILSFLFLDPLYWQGEVIGYVTSFKRRAPDAPPLAELGISKTAIETFQSEGRTLLRLGLSPLAELNDGRFKSNWMLRGSMRTMFRSRLINRYFYNVRGHAEFKSRFRGVAEKTYFASPSFVNDFRFFALMRLCKII